MPEDTAAGARDITRDPLATHRPILYPGLGLPIRSEIRDFSRTSIPMTANCLRSSYCGVSIPLSHFYRCFSNSLSLPTNACEVRTRAWTGAPWTSRKAGPPQFHSSMPTSRVDSTKRGKNTSVKKEEIKDYCKIA
jgi:hypothetical protein